VCTPTALRCISPAKQFTDKPILLGKYEQNETGSGADLSDFYADSTKFTAGLFRQATN
jgi:hypothetical protein